jgi:SAM-dependent methyltransferase
MDAYQRVVLRDRSFFGVHRITRDPSAERHLFVHGGTLHGVQHLDPARRGEPLTYFHRGSPIGQVLSSDRASAFEQVGVVGLGIGVLAAYGQPGQDWVFYEIDPAVERIARDQRYFSYLSDSRATVNVVLGDARQSLGHVPAGRYDLLVLDAFSSDAIPAHLVTREAFQLYFDTLAPGGLIAFHISNRYLDLEPVLGDLAAAAGAASLAQRDLAATPADLANYKKPSHWVLIARNARDLAPFDADARWRPTRRSARGTVWTDDFSNVLSVIRWRRPPLLDFPFSHYHSSLVRKGWSTEERHIMRTRLTVSLRVLIAAGVLTTVATSAQQAGSKIWLGRHAEIEEYIRTAKIVGEEAIELGVTKPRRVLLAPGGPVSAIAFSKVHGRHLGYWDSYKADIAAYEMDKLLQLDMVPPVVERRYQNDLGRASMWVENVRMWDVKQPVVAPDPLAFQRQVVRMKMFDNFIGNTDRNAGNLLLDPAYNLILIDHTRGFTAGDKLVTPMTRSDPELWQRMQAVTEQQLKDAIGKWVSGSQVREVLKRRDRMAAEVARLPAT